MTSLLFSLLKTQIALTASFVMTFSMAMRNIEAGFAEEGLVEPEVPEAQPADEEDDE